LLCCMIRNTVKNITYLQQLQWNFYCFRFYFINKTLVKNEKNNHATKHVYSIKNGIVIGKDYSMLFQS
ncbi:MAG TPA: hypothetical protein VN704_03640, partial [Verrucomicrobiae bacterium]|nr:hypothetical protein [Verrucomicrobiae bacterium]